MVLFALMLPGIIALMGLVVDMGRLLAERRQLQAAADASAWAAATEVLWGSPSNAGAVAQWYAQQNGYGPTSDATVTVSQPPASGAYAVGALTTTFFAGIGAYIGVWASEPPATPQD